MINGIVTSGFGSCSRDMQLGIYDELDRQLYPGSLNVVVGSSLPAKLMCNPDYVLDERPLHHPVLLWESQLVTSEGRLPVLAGWKLKTPYWQELEILSNFHLRDLFELVDGDVVHLEVGST